MKNKELALLIGVGLVAAGVYMLWPRESKAKEIETDWMKIADKYSNAFGIDPALVKAIIMVESSGRPWVSRKEDGYFSYGLMGVTYPTAVDMGYTGSPSGLFDPEINVFYGCKYLRWLADRPHIDTLEKLIAAYNAGPDLQPWPSEYIKKVKEQMRRFSNE